MKTRGCGTWVLGVGMALTASAGCSPGGGEADLGGSPGTGGEHADGATGGAGTDHDTGGTGTGGEDMDGETGGASNDGAGTGGALTGGTSSGGTGIGGTGTGGDGSGGDGGEGGSLGGMGGDDGGCAEGDYDCECGVGREFDPLVGGCVEAIPCDDAESPFGGGLGTEVEPYAICSAEQLGAVSDALDAYFVLARSLDLSGVAAFVPLGAAAAPFEGAFDGAGRVLTGLDSFGSADDAGLFGVVGTSGFVYDLHLVDFEVSGGEGVGMLAGENRGVVAGCTAEGEVVGAEFTGGLVGLNSGTIEESFAQVFLVMGSVDGRAGGLVGQNDGTISGSFSGGEVSGYAVGGLAGGHAADRTITNCYSTAAALGTTVSGGLVAFGTGDIANSYAFAQVGGGQYAGGLIGYAAGPDVTSSYFIDTASDNGVGEPLDASQFAQVGSFVGWDFTSVWRMDAALGRPVLAWED